MRYSFAPINSKNKDEAQEAKMHSHKEILSIALTFLNPKRRKHSMYMYSPPHFPQQVLHIHVQHPAQLITKISITPMVASTP